MHQMIARLIAEGIEPRNMIYVSMDDPMIRTLTEEPFSDVLDHFLERVKRPGKGFIFLDEVHIYKEWYSWVKGYYDREENVKIVISGSSSISLQSEANRSLRGRVVSITVHPFSFMEFLRMKGLSLDRPHFMDDAIDLSSSFSKVKDELNEFMTVGGFPEWASGPVPSWSVPEWFDRLYEDVPRKAFYEDVVRLFNVRNPKALELLLSFIAENQSRVISYESLNQVSNLDRRTLIDYIGYLISTYLVLEVKVFRNRVKQQEKAKKKFLLYDQGIRNSILKDYSIKEENAGFVAENMAGIVLDRFCRESKLHLNYLRRNGEIDFIISDRNVAVPIEVKYSDSPQVSREMLRFMDERSSPHGVFVTRTLSGMTDMDGKMIRLVPFWVLIMGDVGKNVWENASGT
jgi:hypothetical protein